MEIYDVPGFSVHFGACAGSVYRPSFRAWGRSYMCVFFIVEVKVLAGSLVMRAVSKGLNAPDLTFDPVVCEKNLSWKCIQKAWCKQRNLYAPCVSYTEY